MKERLQKCHTSLLDAILLDISGDGIFHIQTIGKKASFTRVEKLRDIWKQPRSSYLYKETDSQ